MQWVYKGWNARASGVSVASRKAIQRNTLDHQNAANKVSLYSFWLVQHSQSIRSILRSLCSQYQSREVTCCFWHLQHACSWYVLSIRLLITIARDRLSLEIVIWVSHDMSMLSNTVPR
jgi:hypothetical protein